MCIDSTPEIQYSVVTELMQNSKCFGPGLQLMYVYLDRPARGSSSLNLTMYLHLSTWYFENVFKLISKPLCQVSLTHGFQGVLDPSHISQAYKERKLNSGDILEHGA